MTLNDHNAPPYPIIAILGACCVAKR